MPSFWRREFIRIFAKAAKESAPCAELALCAELASWRRGRRRERPSDHRTMRGSTTVPVALGIVPTPPGWS